MKTKMYTQKGITKFTIVGFNSLLMMALVFISCGMYGQQNHLKTLLVNNDPNRTGGVDWYGVNKGAFLQANADNSSNPPDVFYFRVAGPIESNSFISAKGNLFSSQGNIYTDNGYIKASKGVQTLGYLYAAGKVFLGGNFDTTGTDEDPTTFYNSNAILTKYSVFVQKGILSEDYALAPKEDWADYVFTKDHLLKPLKEVENYIKENGNLPNIPSGKQIAKDGYNLHEMNVKFLEKIEELTLYTIEQQKSLEAQHLAIVRLEQQVQELLGAAKK